MQRATLENREKPFSDVPSDSKGFAEITYAKARGILDDAAALRPEDPLQLEDALLWLFRTRSIDAIENLNVENLPNLLARYPLGEFLDTTHAAEAPHIVRRAVSETELLSLMLDLDRRLTDEVHEVSLYGEKFHGKGTAFGETFDMNALTAAHRTFPWNTLVRVTNVENEKTVVVRINDRGPFVEGRDMDLSLGAFTTIAERSKGKINARFERLGDATLASPCGEARYQQRLSRDVRFVRGVPHTLPLSGTLELSANKPFVLRGITYPDGYHVRLQDFVLAEERYAFTPAISGTYKFRIGTIKNRVRVFSMEVVHCG